MASTTSLDTAAVLAAARAARREADAAENRLLLQVARWADLYRVDDPRATSVATFGDTPVSLAGEGAPHVSQFAVIEFGAVVGMSRRSVEMLFADVLELVHRLPLTWARVAGGDLKSWRARHIASATQALSPEAAAYVDAQVAPFADRVSPAELQRLIDSAIARFMPGYAEEIAAAAEESQFLQIDADHPSYTGTCLITGELDLPDALDLEQAVRAGAQQQKELGSELPLGARRAKALGNLARGELVLDYNSGLPGSAVLRDVTPPITPPRQVVLYTHMNADGSTFLENAGGHLVTRDQVREWCRTAGSVIVRPVIDLDEEITAPGYRPTDTQREQVALRDRWCPSDEVGWSRAGGRDAGAPAEVARAPGQRSRRGPCRDRRPGEDQPPPLRSSDRFSPARLRRPPADPHGYVFLKDRTGTQDLTPRPVDPPGSNGSP